MVRDRTWREPRSARRDLERNVNAVARGPRRRRTMRNLKLGLVAVVLAVVASAQLAQAQGTPQPSQRPAPGPTPGAQGSMTTATTPDQVMKEVEQTFGFVPQL